MMDLSRIFGNSLLVGAKSLDYLWEKQSVTAHNISNKDTPGYKAKYLTFEDMFRSKLEDASGDRAAVRQAAKSAVWLTHESDTESTRVDGNNVVEDAEQTELTRTALQYQQQIQTINSDIARLSAVIKG